MYVEKGADFGGKDETKFGKGAMLLHDSSTICQGQDSP